MDDSSGNFKLYMGQKLLCQVKHLAFIETRREVVEYEAGTIGIFTMEYKIKHQPRMYREKYTDWYDQKWLS